MGGRSKKPSSTRMARQDTKLRMSQRLVSAESSSPPPTQPHASLARLTHNTHSLFSFRTSAQIMEGNLNSLQLLNASSLATSCEAIPPWHLPNRASTTPTQLTESGFTVTVQPSFQ